MERTKERAMERAKERAKEQGEEKNIRGGESGAVCFEGAIAFIELVGRRPCQRGAELSHPGSFHPTTSKSFTWSMSNMFAAGHDKLCPFRVFRLGWDHTVGPSPSTRKADFAFPRIPSVDIPVWVSDRQGTI
eukprot:2933695-Amphidinium_carterae.1